MASAAKTVLAFFVTNIAQLSTFYQLFENLFFFSAKNNYLCSIFYTITMSQTIQQLNIFESQVDKLLEEKLQLQAEKRQLEATLAQKKEELIDAHDQIVEWRTKYENLKIARSLGNTEEEKKTAYRRLSSMVREVDICLNLLKD